LSLLTKEEKWRILVRLEPVGVLTDAELHWYEAHGVGKVESYLYPRNRFMPMHITAPLEERLLAVA